MCCMMIVNTVKCKEMLNSVIWMYDEGHILRSWVFCDL